MVWHACFQTPPPFSVNPTAIYLKPRYLQSEQVALQAVSDEDGLSAEHAEQHSLDVSEADGHVLQILFGHTRESTRYMQCVFKFNFPFQKLKGNYD